MLSGECCSTSCKSPFATDCVSAQRKKLFSKVSMGSPEGHRDVGGKVEDWSCKRSCVILLPFHDEPKADNHSQQKQKSPRRRRALFIRRRWVPAYFAGDQGFEPQFPRPERGVLPLHQSPKRRVFYHLFVLYRFFQGQLAPRIKVEWSTESSLITHLTQPGERDSIPEG
jgi:hypothetical protein